MFFNPKKKKEKRKRERSCFRFKKKRDFDFENVLSSMKWWSLRHPQWPKKHQIFLPFAQKKKRNQIYYIFVEEEPKKPKDKQIYNDLSASVEAFFAALAFGACTYERERERDMKRKSEMGKLYAQNYCWTKRVDVWISKCVVVGILTCKCVEGKKKSSGQWYWYPLVHLLFLIWKVKKITKIFYSGLVGYGCLYMFFCFVFVLVELCWVVSKSW